MTVKERLKLYLKQKNINASEFGRTIGVSNAYISSIVQSIPPDKLQRITLNYPDLNTSWLLTGEGEMLKEETPSEGVSASSDQYPMVESYPIPVYNLDAVAGMNTPNAVVDMPAYIERWIQFPGARKGDIAFPVSNDSMIPRYLPGSLLQVRKVELWQEYFGYGNNFVLFLTDGRRILKEIQRSEEDPKTQVLCVSCNTKYPPEELPKSLIREVYKVIKSLSDEGF